MLANSDRLGHRGAVRTPPCAVPAPTLLAVQNVAVGAAVPGMIGTIVPAVAVAAVPKADCVTVHATEQYTTATSISMFCAPLAGCWTVADIPELLSETSPVVAAQ